MENEYGLKAQIAAANDLELLAENILISLTAKENIPIQSDKPKFQSEPLIPPRINEPTKGKDRKQRFFQIFFGKFRLLFANISTLIVLIVEEESRV